MRMTSATRLLLLATTISHAALAQHAGHDDAAPAHASPAQQQVPAAAHDMSGMNTDPWLHHVRVDQFEWRDGDEASVMAWKASAWSGTSTGKLWLDAEGERVRGDTRHAEVQLLYSRAVSTYWDLQAGIRSDLQPAPDRHWATIGIRGLAPFYFDVDAQLFIADHGHTGAKLNIEYEMRLLQRLVLVPELELNAYGKDDAQRDNYSGLCELKAGLRLHYEFARQFSPYVGISHERRLSAPDHGDADRSETAIVAGISAWL
jgi:copper resistance protein B